MNYKLKVKIFANQKRKQFISLAENAVNFLYKKSAEPLCTDYDSYIDMIIINSITKSANSNSKKIKIKY